MNNELKQELFRKILSEMIDTKYEALDDKEILMIADGAVKAFIKNYIKK